MHNGMNISKSLHGMVALLCLGAWGFMIFVLPFFSAVLLSWPVLLAIKYRRQLMAAFNDSHVIEAKFTASTSPPTRQAYKPAPPVEHKPVKPVNPVIPSDEIFYGRPAAAPVPAHKPKPAATPAPTKAPADAALVEEITQALVAFKHAKAEAKRLAEGAVAAGAKDVMDGIRMAYSKAVTYQR